MVQLTSNFQGTPSMSALAKPNPKFKFTFGLWTIGNPGRDPFGLPTRETIPPPQIADILGEVGAYGVNFHDNDLIPIDATPVEADRIKKDFKKALKDNGLVVPMATTNLFGDPVFKDGAFTSNNAAVRAYGIQKTMRAMDLGAEFGARDLCVLGRPGGCGKRCDQGSDLPPSSGFARQSISFVNTASAGNTTSSSHSRPSPTNRAGTFILR